MQIDEIKFNTAYKLADENTKKILDALVENDSTTERIETLDDAIRYLGEEDPLVESYNSSINTINIDAYIELCIITKALNGGITPKNTEVYFPVFIKTSDNTFVLDDIISSGEVMYQFYSNYLCYKTEELAKYSAIHFLDFWRRFLQ